MQIYTFVNAGANIIIHFLYMPGENEYASKFEIAVVHPIVNLSMRRTMIIVLCGYVNIELKNEW